METELQEYLENEYAEFEQRYLQGQRFWRVPVSALHDTSLFAFFEQFCALFPDHPSEHNTLFYLLEHSTIGHSVLFTCTHFEHGSLDEVRALMGLLERFASVFVRDGNVELIGLELLDDYGEKLRIRFHDVNRDIVALLQQHSTRSAA